MFNKLNKRLPLINSMSQSFVSFSKGYTAETKEYLETKVKFAKNGTIDYLCSLDIIPRHISIEGNNIFYYLDDGKVATKVNFKIHYHHLEESSSEERSNISNNISKQMHHLEHLKNKCKTCRGHLYVLDRVPGVKNNIQEKVIKAFSQEELIEKTKQSIWDLLKEKDNSNIVIDCVDITYIEFYQTPEGFEAHYRYTVSKLQKRTKDTHGDVKDNNER